MQFAFPSKLLDAPLVQAETAGHGLDIAGKRAGFRKLGEIGIFLVSHRLTVKSGYPLKTFSQRRCIWPKLQFSLGQFFAGLNPCSHPLPYHDPMRPYSSLIIFNSERNSSLPTGDKQLDSRLAGGAGGGTGLTAPDGGIGFDPFFMGSS